MWRKGWLLLIEDPWRWVWLHGLGRRSKAAPRASDGATEGPRGTAAPVAGETGGRTSKRGKPDLFSSARFMFRQLSVRTCRTDCAMSTLNSALNKWYHCLSQFWLFKAEFLSNGCLCGNILGDSLRVVWRCVPYQTRKIVYFRIRTLYPYL